MSLFRWWNSLNTIEKPIWMFGLFLHVLAFFYCTGYQHGDEHFQILEFAGYKLNLCTYDSLAWEYPAQMRPGLQPFIAFCFGKLSLLFFGKIDPFWISDILRFISLTLGFISMIAIRKLATMLYQNTNQRILISFLLNFLWFLPFLHARYSSENWSGIFMIYAICQLFKNGLEINKSKSYSFFLSGLFWGISFQFRYQIGLAFLGLLIWIIVINKNGVKPTIYILLGGLITLFLAIIADYWLYNEFVFPPYNYLYQNLFAGKAATFGISPWYGYFDLIISWLGPPFDFVFIAFILSVLSKLRKSPFSYIFILFILLHSIIGHKEIRFLFPVFYLIPIITVQLIPESWLNKQEDFYSSALKKAIIVVFIVSIGIKSIITSISYASPDLNTFRKLNDLSKENGKITVYCPYDIGYVMAHYYEFRFFRNDNISLRFFHNNEQLIAQNPINSNQFILVWDHFTSWPSEQGAKCIYKSISDYQKSYLFRGSLWNRDEYSIYSFNPN